MVRSSRASQIRFYILLVSVLVLLRTSTSCFSLCEWNLQDTHRIKFGPFNISLWFWWVRVRKWKRRGATSENITRDNSFLVILNENNSLWVNGGQASSFARKYNSCAHTISLVDVVRTNLLASYNLCTMNDTEHSEVHNTHVLDRTTAI